MKPEFSVAIPAYNEEECIEEAVKRTQEALKRGRIRAEIIVIDDGSTDRTYEICRGLVRRYGIRLERHKKNMNYGKAIFTGIKAATGEYFTYLDADLQYRPEDMVRMYKFAKKNKLDLVVCKPINKGQNPIRGLLTGTFRLVTIILFGIRIKDVNTLKVAKTKYLKKIRIDLGAWMVGLEILARLKKMSLYPKEYKLKVYPRIGGTSKRSVSSIFKTFYYILLLRAKI